MIPVLEEALDELLHKYDHMPIDEIISVLELKLHALREEAAADDDESTDGG